MTNSKKKKIESKINKAIESVRPYLQMDGGDISFVELTDENIVKVKLLGACHACPMSIQTLKLGVEKAIKNIVPEIKEVVAVDYGLEDTFPEGI
ncbi:MAG: hypothetical protein B6I20_10680 [Bacteroidetes bacterium 4572_117]|nr:MAG: hypothetical protein B6I20_10680 [Bacteroidetes bacterium 4572_117]